MAVILQFMLLLILQYSGKTVSMEMIELLIIGILLVA